MDTRTYDGVSDGSLYGGSNYGDGGTTFMIQFIKLTDALTNQKILIKTSLIATVEECYGQCGTNSTSVRRLTFVDNRMDQYVTESMAQIADYLCNS